MKRINMCFKYLILFLFFFVCLVFIFTVNKGDTYVNFGFSYAISKGEIPYKDFNLVITPFAPFLYSIGLLLRKSILIYFLEQSILLTFLFYILEKILNKKVYLFLLGMLIPYPIAMSTTIFPGYNFLLFFLLIILCYLEIHNKEDWMIGIILGIMFCTKQTVGFLLLLPSFVYFWKNQRKVLKRIIGFLIPIIILLIYLVITNSFFEFFHLCFLGLLDFGNHNQYIEPFYAILWILGIIYLIYRIYKNKKELINYEILLFSSIAFPILDYYHVSLFLLGVVFLFLKDYSLTRNITKYTICVICVICILWTIITKEFFQDPIIVNYHNFEWTVTSKNYYKDSIRLQEYLKKIDQRKIYSLRGSENYFYKIIKEEPITYYDLPNYGNYGYHGIEKMKRKIEEEKNVVFILDKSLLKETNKNQQYIVEFAKLIKKTSKKIKTIGTYEIYLKK